MTKQKYFLYSIPVIIVAAVAAYFIFSRSSDAYLKMLPKDATALARFDVRELIDDADLSATDLYRLVTTSNDTPESAPLGIDMQRPIYAFVTGSGNMGLAAAVSDIDDLHQRLDDMQARGKASERSQQRGYEWVVLDGQWLMAFDSEKALAMGPAVGAAQDALRAEMATLLAQKRKDSAAETQLFAILQDSDEPLAAVVAPEIIPSEGRKALYHLGIRSQSDALLLLTLGTDGNELELNAKILAQTDGVKEKMLQLNKALRPLTAKNIENTHANNVAWMAMNIEGKSIVTFLRSRTSTRTALIALNIILDLDQILQAIDGDIALELMSPVSVARGLNLSDIQDFCLTAELSNTDFMRFSSRWGNDYIRVNALSTDDLSIHISDAELFFGAKDKHLYFSNAQGLPAEGNAYLREQRDDIDDCRFYATFFAPALISALVSEAATNGLDISLPLALQQFQRLNIMMKEAGELHLSLIAPEGLNIARELIKP